MTERRRELQGTAAPSCVVRRCGDRAFRIEGDLDASTAGTLFCDMGDQITGAGDLVLDLADLASTDCSGANALVDIAGKLDGDLILLSPQPAVAQVLRTAKICERFPNVVVFYTPRPSH